MLTSPALVLDRPGVMPELEEVTVGEPGPGEVRLRLAYSGICHTDLSAIRNTLVWPLVLGHEGAGVVESVGAGVRHVAEGDHVILAWRAACGQCRRCLNGRQDLCESVQTTAQPRLHRQNGQALYLILNAGTFCQYAVVPAAAAIPIDRRMPLDKAALIGCAVATGLCAVLRNEAIQAGDSVAVFGAGGVGLNVVQGARLARAGRIIAVDILDSKLQYALDFGATDVIRADQTDPVEAIMALTNGRGVEWAFEAVGLPRLMDQALQTLARGGELVLLGGAEAEATLTFQPRWFLSKQKSIRGSVYGSCRPALDFPNFVDWYLAGHIQLDPLLSTRIRLEDLPRAIASEPAAGSIRTVVEFA